MIKANELRIGNSIKDGQLGVVKVTGILEDLCFIICEKDTEGFGPQYWHYSIKWEQLSPIPLTPEVLEKCGFEESDFIGVKTGVYKKYGLKVGLSEDDIVQDQLTAVCNEQGISVKVKHLHQLQNLYYALTGEELEYNP